MELHYCYTSGTSGILVRENAHGVSDQPPEKALVVTSSSGKDYKILVPAALRDEFEAEFKAKPCYLCSGSGVVDGCILCGAAFPTWPQPKNDWVLVRTDALAEKHGSIILPGKGSIYTATVLAVGPGTEIPIDHNKPEEKRFIPTDVKPGEMVAFLRWTIESQQGKAVKSTFEELGADIALIKERDILFVMELEPDEKVVLTL